MKKQRVKKKIKKFSKKTWLIMSIFLGVLAILAVYLLYNNTNNTPKSTLSIGNSPVLGDKNAPVTIYEFSDFSCPFCAAASGQNQDLSAQQAVNFIKSTAPDWEAPLPGIVKEYVLSKKVRIVFKYFPGHGEGLAAHAVGIALTEQGNEFFWKFYALAFANRAETGDLVKMEALAKLTGADMAKLEIALTNTTKINEQLTSDIKEASANTVTATPVFFVNSQRVEGAQSFSTFKEIIDKELKK
jgi:protein-disulfide isomerase